MKPLVAALVVVLLATACGSGSEKFCKTGLVIPSVDVDVRSLPMAHEVCLSGAECVPVRDGTAELRSPLITNETSDVGLSVRDDEAVVLAEAEVRLPRTYGNGFDCDGDGPGGTVTFDPEGGVAVTADIDGSGNTR